MEIEWRPLNLGEVLDRTIQIYRSRFLMFAGIVALGSGIVTLSQLANTFSMRFLRATYTHRTPGLITSGLAILPWIFEQMVWMVVLSALYRAVADLYTRQATGVVQSYSAIRPHWFRYVRLGLTKLALCLLPIGVPTLSLVFLVGAQEQIRRTMGTTGLGILFVIASLLSAVGFVFGVWLWFRYVFVGPACVFENIGIVQSFRRSSVLSKGQRLRLLVVFLLEVSITFAIYGLFISPELRFMFHHHGRIPTAAYIPVLLLNFFIRVLALPIQGIGWMVCYFDARIRQEGFDVEWMLERSSGRAGLHEPRETSLPEITGLNAV